MPLTQALLLLPGGSGFGARIGALAAAAALCVGVGGALYSAASGLPWGVSVVRAYGVLFRAPGIGLFAEPTVLAALVAHSLYVFSLFLFSALLGTITDLIKEQIQAIREGSLKLPLRGHVLVLGWSTALLRQLSHAQGDPRSRLYGRPVVVLSSEQSKASMDAAVAAVCKGGSRLQVFCRSGEPTKQRELERVAAEAADTVILLQPATSSSGGPAAAEALQAMALVSLLALRQQHSGGPGRCARAVAILRAALGRDSSSTNSSGVRIIVQEAAAVPSGGGARAEQGAISFLQAAAASSGEHIQTCGLLTPTMLQTLVAQTALEPGVATVFRELMRPGADACLAWCTVDEQLPASGGFSRAASLFTDTVLLGVQPAAAAGQQVMLNPPDSFLLAPNDRLVGITRLAQMAPRGLSPSPSKQRAVKRSISRVSSVSSPQLASLSLTGSSKAAASPAPSGHRCRRVILCGWHAAAAGGVLQQLQALAPATHVTVLLPPASGKPDSDGQQNWASTSAGGTVEVVHSSDPGSWAALLQAGIADACAVIIIGGSMAADAGAAPSSEADALVGAALLAVQQATAVAGSHAATTRLHVVAVLSSWSVRRSLQAYLSTSLSCKFSFELLVLEELAAGMLVLVAQEPGNAQVMAAAASSLAVCSLQQLGIVAGDTASLDDVHAAARQRRCTVLGYRRADGRMQLVPPEGVALSPRDRVVVLGAPGRRRQSSACGGLVGG